MKNQRVFLGFSIIAVAFAAAIIVRFFAMGTEEVPVLKHRFDQIRVGMTEQEVDLAMQLPPGDHRSFVPGTGYFIRDPKRPSSSDPNCAPRSPGRASSFSSTTMAICYRSTVGQHEISSCAFTSVRRAA